MIRRMPLVVVVTLLISAALAQADRPYAGRTVSILLSQQASTEELRDVYIPRFEEATGIDVVVDILPESGMDAKMVLALSGNTGEYDVLMTGAKNWSQLVSSGWILPLDNYLSSAPARYKSGFSESLLNSLRLDGQVYAAPFQVGANLLFYNRSMFEAAGLDPDVGPASLDELLEYAERLHQPAKGQYGIVMRGTREGNANSFSWIMFWFLNGGRWVDVEGRNSYEVLDLPEAVGTTEYFARLAQFGPPGIASYGFPEALLAMQQGRVAMWLDAAQLGLALENEAESRIAGNVGYHVIPGEGDDYVVGPVWALSIAASASDPDAAWQLIQYLTGFEVTKGQVLSGTNGSAARLDVLVDGDIAAALNADFADALMEAINYTNPHYTPLIPEGGEIRAALSIAISKVLSGQATAGQAMQEAHKEVLSILKRAGY
jgi:multiple sugar transport system substrate-binding protein